MNHCRLCSINSEGQTESWNTPLFESENFVVLPSLGSLVEGWLLVVPRVHFICMGALPNSVAAELQQLKLGVVSVTQELYGEVCAFEHGPSRPNLRLGCGVDHAHLHIVPVGFDLAAAVSPFLPDDVKWSEGSLPECQSAYNREEDYLYLEQPIGNGRIAKNSRFEGQLFRRAIAAALDSPQEFNWREHPQLSTVAATITRMMCSTRGELPCQIPTKAAA